MFKSPLRSTDDMNISQTNMLCDKNYKKRKKEFFKVVE